MLIDQLEAGDELDWLVLHHVFDWKRGIAAFGEAPYRRGSQEFLALWPMSTDIASAWRLIDHAAAVGLHVSIQNHPGTPSLGWRVEFGRPAGEAVYALGGTLPLAICRAALRAVEAALLVKSSRTLEPWPSANGDTLN